MEKVKMCIWLVMGAVALCGTIWFFLDGIYRLRDWRKSQQTC